jgi:hemoglobin
MWPDFPKPPPEPRPNPAIFEALGVEGVKKLIRMFYEEIGRSPVAKLFPTDHDALMASADNSALFWVTMLGGPPLYEQKHGKPMIRQRHLRFVITGKDREHWLACWEPVLATAPQTLGFPEEHIPGFRAWINTFSAYIVNTAGPSTGGGAEPGAPRG